VASNDSQRLANQSENPRIGAECGPVIAVFQYRWNQQPYGIEFVSD
jgi:hypothetical protein